MTNGPPSWINANYAIWFNDDYSDWVVGVLVNEEAALGSLKLIIRVPHVLLILPQIGIFTIPVNGILWLAHHSLAHKQKVRRPY